MKVNGGGSPVFIGSKNGIAAATNASAYASAKAASLNLARCLALEGASSASLGLGFHAINSNTFQD
jgi:NAD(P)-dependent dehydrogenase (short-subunit alcohol dehydrogenase family)